MKVEIRKAVTAGLLGLMVLPVSAQEFQAGPPLSAINQAGEYVPMSDNVKVYGSFHFTESCTFDAEKNLIVSMNAGVRAEGAPADGFVSLINPDGSVHTPRFIGLTRDGLELIDPIGSAVRNGVLYTVDSGYLRSFDLASGQPLNSFQVPGAGFLNGIGVAEDGTAFISDSNNGVIIEVTPAGNSSIFYEGPALDRPNGVAIDNDGNVVVVNINTNDVVTFNRNGEVILTEHSVEAGNDGVVVTPDGTKYTSSVRFGSVSRIRPGREAEVIASGIPSAASMCYDSVQHQLVIPMNPNNALAFIKL